jgi:EF-P beta-lysylation protein EpmB
MPSVSLQDFASRQPEKSSRELWKKELSEAISSPVELLRTLELEHLLSEFVDVDSSFRLRVPHAYVAKMQKGNPEDPLLRQVLPTLKEKDPSGSRDPVGDLHALLSPGLLHKYHGRALLITTGACAIHCRYCFRRHFPYAENNGQSSNWQSALDYLRTHMEIQEVILSGGDPLVLDDVKLETLCSELETIEHVKWLRLHTRLPVVLPSRINHSLLQWMEKSRFRITVVIHANHAQELGFNEEQALQQLRDIGVTLLNQSVLLRGVNDNTSNLVNLSERLHDVGVIPYYLHLLDKVQGALHFEVNHSKACEIVDNMRAQLPGFLVPRLVREESGASSKTAISGI